MPYTNYFEQLKIAIPLLMDEHNVPGLSIAVSANGHEAELSTKAAIQNESAAFAQLTGRSVR